MSRLTQLFGELGQGFQNIFSSPQILYAFYVVIFIMGIFAIFNRLLQTVKPIKGRAATVVSWMITLITVGAVFYGKSYSDIINQFNNIVFLFVALIAAGGFGFWMYTLIKKAKHRAHKIFLFSLASYIITSMLITYPQGGLEPTGGLFIEVFGNEGAAAVFVSILDLFNLGGFIGIWVGLIWSAVLLFTGLGGDKSPEKKKEKDDVQLIRDLLKNIATTINETNDIFKNKLDILNQLAGTQVENNRGKALKALNNAYGSLGRATWYGAEQAKKAGASAYNSARNVASTGADGARYLAGNLAEKNANRGSNKRDRSLDGIENSDDYAGDMKDLGNSYLNGGGK